MRTTTVAIVFVASVLGVMPGLSHARFYEYMLGDDDGFGVAGTGGFADDFQVNPGQTISSWGPADGDGTDEIFLSGDDRQDFVFTFDTFSSIMSASLFIQYIDWPEFEVGRLWIDDVQTDVVFPLIPVDQEAPWTVLGKTIDLTPYAEHLYDGYAVFGFTGGDTDGYVIDYMKLSIEGSAVPLPGAILLGALGVGLVGCLRRRRAL